MNEQKFTQSNEISHGSKSIWTIVTSVVIAAVIVGGSVYAWQKISMGLTKQSLQKQVVILKNQIEEIQKTQSIDNSQTIKNIALEENNPTETVTQRPSLPTTCIDQREAAPVITSISSYSGSIGTKLEIKGCNFAGFEGDLEVWIENNQGIKGLLYADKGSTAKLLKLTLKSPLCQERTSYSGLPCNDWLNLVPGEYKIYTAPWGKESNKVKFIVK